MRRIRELSGRAAEQAGVVQSLQETVQGMRVVKSYTAEATMRERFDHAAQDICASAPTTSCASAPGPRR